MAAVDAMLSAELGDELSTEACGKLGSEAGGTMLRFFERRVGDMRIPPFGPG